MNAKTQVSVQQQLLNIRSQVEEIVSQLLSEHQSTQDTQQKTIEIGRLIDSLPFATDQYALAKNRLLNAQRYYRSNELGAARYELRLMLGQLGRTFI